jgi:hypothetical protein
MTERGSLNGLDGVLVRDLRCCRRWMVNFKSSRTPLWTCCSRFSAEVGHADYCQ